MKKRILSILLALSMITCLMGALSTTVSAAAPTKVYVGGVSVVGGGYWVSDGDGGITQTGASASNYTVKYTSGTLTLNGAEITKCYDWASDCSAAIYVDDDLNIELLGDSSVTGKDNGYSYGVFHWAGTLTISGSGSLNATAGTARGYSFGIIAESLVINGGTVIATGGTSKANSAGISSFGNISITDGTVTATGGQSGSAASYESSWGLAANGSIEISGGSVTATADNAYYLSKGLSAGTTVTISGDAVVCATGSQATKSDGMSYGISGDHIFISGGTVTAESGIATKSSAMETAPNLTGYASYEWRTSEGGTYSTDAYIWLASSNYVEFRFSFVPVTGITITNSDSVAVNTNLALAGTVAPANATNKTIEWSVQDDGGTGAAISDGTFRATAAGTATLQATIENGLSETEDYIQAFPITVTAAPASASNSTSGSTSNNNPLYSSTDPSTGIKADGSFSDGISVYYLTKTATGRANELVDALTYNQLLKAVGNSYSPVGAYDISAQGYSGPLTLTFPVGAQHNGRAFMVKHKTSSGTIESFSGIVTDGNVVITVSSLSPFMIAIKNGVEIPETGATSLLSYICGMVQSWIEPSFNRA